MTTISSIGVVGAGQMGRGIAQVAAMSGFQTLICDANPDALDAGLAFIDKQLKRGVEKGKWDEAKASETMGNLEKVVGVEGLGQCDLIIEAATENKPIKFEIFKSLDKVAKEGAILATNPSSISITEIAAVTSRPALVAGMHFMNPVPVMKLVEIIRGYSTTNEVTESIMDLSRKLNKIPVEVNDYPGFVANRILMPMINEAICTLHEGVAGVSEIDTGMKLGMAHPMGPLQLADFIGLDVCLAIMEVLYDGFGNPKYAPCPLLVNMVTAGKLGVKSGEGFYSWGHGTKDLIVSDKFKN